jgi:signal transduction histidine kinase
MRHSIRWRLVAGFVLLTLLTVGTLGVLTLSLVERYVVERETEHLRANAEAVARRALPLMHPVPSRAGLLELVNTASFLGDTRVRISNHRHDILADSGSPSVRGNLIWVLPTEINLPEMAEGEFISFVITAYSGQTMTIPAPAQPFPLGQTSDWSFTVARHWSDPWGERFTFHTEDLVEHRVEVNPNLDVTPRSNLMIRAPIGDPGSPTGFVEISDGPDASQEALMATSRAFLLAAGGATVIAGLVGLLVSRGLSAPIRELTEITASMSTGDLSLRAPVRGRGETALLAQQFNRMAERLEASFSELAAERDALRRFVTDASHELRTPITALKNFVTLLHGPAATDPAAQAEFLEQSQLQVERLEWITQNLLDLSRLEAGLTALNISSCRAEKLIQTAAAAFKGAAAEKGVELAIQSPLPSIELNCDQEWIHLALSNLLDNAVKFTPAGGRVEIGASVGEESIRLWVKDSGPGIDPPDQPHIFERFYRGRGERAEGSGLGLAIVQSTAQAHGGQVTFRSDADAGSLFVIELPQTD